MPVAQLVALRNLKRGVVVLTPDPRDPKTYLEFQAAGDPGGGDVHYISEEAMTLPAVVKGILHGTFAMEEDTLSEIVAQSFQAQMVVAQRQREQAEQQIAASITRTDNKDLLGTPCVGPSIQPGKACGESVAIREQELKETPPLCPRHVSMAGEYIPTDDFDGEKHITRWTRATLGAREREQK